jgi:hypothetical protein
MWKVAALCAALAVTAQAQAGWRQDMQTAGFNAEAGNKEALRALDLLRAGKKNDGCLLVRQAQQKLRFATESVARIYKEQKGQASEQDVEQIRQAGEMTVKSWRAAEQIEAQHCK